jgi:hypothetical protein
MHLGESIRDALLKRPLFPMPPEERFPGAGIYALYYTGKFPAYEAMAARNRDGRFELPIYVGEAVPEGARKGGVLDPAKPTFKLAARLREHANSIRATNLRIEDFAYRFLVVEDIWIPLGEALMIHTFAPVWNKIVDGFGIHTPGKNRPQTISAWDTLHPGRGFVKKVNLLPNPRSQKEWIKDVRRYLELPREEQLQRPTVETGEED